MIKYYKTIKEVVGSIMVVESVSGVGHPIILFHGLLRQAHHVSALRQHCLFLCIRKFNKVIHKV